MSIKKDNSNGFSNHIGENHFKQAKLVPHISSESCENTENYDIMSLQNLKAPEIFGEKNAF